MKYAILNTNDINTVDFSKVKQERAVDVRKNLDGTKFIVKFEGDTPDFLDGITIYTNEEILAVIWNPNNGWQTEDDE